MEVCLMSAEDLLIRRIAGNRVECSRPGGRVYKGRLMGIAYLRGKYFAVMEDVEYYPGKMSDFLYPCVDVTARCQRTWHGLEFQMAGGGTVVFR